MRILTVSYEFPPLGGGGARVVYGVARELTRRGHEVDVVTMGYPGLPAEEVVDGVRVRRVGQPRKRPDVCHTREMIRHHLKAIPELLDRIRQGRYDVNHTHFIFPDGVASAVARWRTGLPFVVTAHGSDVPGYNPDRFQFQHRLLSPVWRRVTASADAIVCPSRHLETLVRRQRAGASTLVVPNGIDTDRFTPRQQPGGRRVLVVTRMFPRKGVQYLLRALEAFDLRARVDIVGDGPYLDELRELASRLRVDVRFRGWLDNDSPELRRLFERANIFVFTSHSENFPINLLEAMVAGCAIVTSDTSGCAEVVGDAAVLVTPGDVVQLGRALERLLEDPEECRKLGAVARDRVVSRFSWPAVGARYEEVLAARARPSARALGSPPDA